MSIKKINVAIVGATGMVGRTFLKVLEDRKFPIHNLYLYSSSKSAGSHVNFNGNGHTISFNPLVQYSAVQRDFSPFNLGGDNILENVIINIG